ncbi:transcription termination factor NusA [Allocoprobacillus halotolerans]|uniref:Transcription termination/antitermination protein NusA n=1 Tax=Allocoprobacillus halotolerans TaxID=2944914 RepID=A0ABY5I3U3_9FIRM|nr:transcription termination factor NusA [Allocoprobacillus halotolerans]UTY38713.1 transcription termination factor NusA [Allocoprobacillus halotolerans]
MASKKFIQALDLLESEKGIKKEVVLDALKEALEKSYKKNYGGPESIIRVEINEVTGKIRLYEIKHVVDDVNDEDYELSLEEAQMINPKYQIGDDVVTEVDPEVFGRLAAIQTKQLLKQKIREAEKETLYNEYIDKKDDIINGTVDRVEERFAIINIGRTGALLPLNQQIPGEKIYEGQRIKVYVSDVERNTKGTHIGVSRTEPGLVKRLFEMEVPEIYDGTVEIKSVSREAGDRSKIAVYTSHENIDPIGACVGPKGARVRNVVNELNGEMIDIIEWSEDPVVYISHALSPSDVEYVDVDEEKHSALVIVPDNQLSLAIGKRGQNARLAVRLTGWKIDIKSVTEAANEGIVYGEDAEFEKSFEAQMTQEEPLVEDDFEEEIFDFEEETPEMVTDHEESDIIEEDSQAMAEQDNQDFEEFDDYDEDYDDEYEDYDYDPKYDEDIDYDEFDKYYDEK